MHTSNTLSATNPAVTPTVNWRTHLSLALLALVYIFSFIDRQVLSILLEPIKQEFGASDTQMGLLTGLAFAVLYAALGIPVGRLADTHNRRNIVAICCGIWSLATMACGVATQYWHMFIARMTVAVGEAGGMGPSISVVSDLYPPKMRSFAISLFMMGPNLGTLLGLVIGGMVAQFYGWRAVFLAFGLPGVILALLVYLFVKEPVRGAYEQTAAKPAPIATQEPRESMLRQVMRLLGMSAMRNICLACGIAGIAGYGYGVWAPSFFMRTHGMNIAQAGLVFGLASGLGAVVGAMFCGKLCDKLVQRDERWQLRLAAIGTLCAVPSGIGVFLWPEADFWMLGSIKVPYAMAFALAFGFFGSWFATLSYSAVSQMVKSSERSVSAALLNLFMTLLGVGMGPLVTGVLSDYFGKTHGADGLRFALMGVVSLFILTVLFFTLAIKPYQQRLQQLRNAA